MLKSEIGTIIIRVIVGITFFTHGFTKFQSGISNIVDNFGHLGLLVFLAYIIALIKLIGGVALILGIGTRIIAGIFAVIMLGTIFAFKLSDGFLGNIQLAGYEFELVMFAMSTYLVLANPTKYSLIHSVYHKQ